MTTIHDLCESVRQSMALIEANVPDADAAPEGDLRRAMFALDYHADAAAEIARQIRLHLEAST